MTKKDVAAIAKYVCEFTALSNGAVIAFISNSAVELGMTARRHLEKALKIHNIDKASSYMDVNGFC